MKFLKLLTLERQRFTIIARTIIFIELEHCIHPFKPEQILTSANETEHHLLPAHRTAGDFQVSREPISAQVQVQVKRLPHKHSTFTLILSFHSPDHYQLSPSSPSLPSTSRTVQYLGHPHPTNRHAALTPMALPSPPQRALCPHHHPPDPHKPPHRPPLHPRLPPLQALLSSPLPLRRPAPPLANVSALARFDGEAVREGEREGAE